MEFRMKYLTLIVIAVLFITSCGLKLDRKNPLDPHGGGLGAPEKVIVYELPLSSSGSVLLQWHPQNDADGFRIYRSLSYNGNYDLIETELTGDDVSFEDIGSDLVSETWYYYKVSAVNETGLEGYRSEPVYTYFLDESSK